MKNLHRVLVTIFASLMILPLAAAQTTTWDKQINSIGQFQVLS